MSRSSPASRLVVAFVLPVVASGCASWVPRPTSAPDAPYGRDPKVSPGTLPPGNGGSAVDATSELARFLKLDADARMAPTDVSLNMRYLNAGFGLSDRMCSEWFISIEASRQTAEFRQGTTALTGTLAGTLMGLFSSAPKEIGAAAAVFGGIHHWFNMGKATFFLTPKLGTVHSKLKELRDSLATELRSDPATTSSFERAYRALASYQDTCGILEMQRFIDTATELARYELITPGQLDPVTAVQLEALTSQLLKAIDWPVTSAKVDPGTLKELYFLRFESTLAADLGFPTAQLARELNAAYPTAAENTEKKQLADRLLSTIGSLLEVAKEVQKARTTTPDSLQLKALGQEIRAGDRSAPAQIRIVPAR